jgi:hypothetical protein
MLEDAAQAQPGSDPGNAGRRAHYLGEISGYANAVLRLSPDDRVECLAQAVADAAAKSAANPDDASHAQTLVTSVCALAFCLVGQPADGGNGKKTAH